MEVLTISGITKHYGAITALKNVSFTVPEGSVYGLLGPNGSGKTTLLGVVTDVLRPSAGAYRFFDGSKPVNEIRKDMGVLLETPNFYPYLSACQNLRIVAKIKGCDPADIPAALKKVNLFERRHSSFKTFSLGMKQRLGIASTLLGSPKIIILDEPTNGLDPEGISEIRQLIRQLAGEGKTVILASHLLDEVEKVCTHVAILKKGALLTAGDIDGALSHKKTVIEVVADDLERLAEVLKTLHGVLAVTVADDAVSIAHRAGELTPQQVNRHCFDNGIVLGRLTVKSENLESIFLELTK
jgi:ABC-2 type transport system ATP-binding protein